MSNLELESVIEDSIQDATDPSPDSTDTTETLEASPEAPTETPEAPESPSEPTEATNPETLEVASPGARQASPTTPEDDFAKKHGLSPQMSSGRENRIPYSRVKAIVTKAEQKALEPVQKELEGYRGKVTEYEAKVSDYEARLTNVGQFEQIMVKDPERFLSMLATIPAYQQIFSNLTVKDATPQQAQGSLPSDMPQPDQKLGDGSAVYSMEGLAKLNEWNRAKAREEALVQARQEMDQRFGPIEQAWRANEHLNRVIPVVQQQISEARQWPLFNENEADIVKALQADQNLSLQAAYAKVVYPRLAADRTKIREEVLADIKRAPNGPTAVTTRTAKPAPVSLGNRSLEAVIRESIQGVDR